MRKIISIGLVLTLLFLTSCSLLGGASLEKADQLLDDEKYSEAIDMYQELIDEDELEFDAWFGIVEAYMQDDEYGDTEDTLEDMLEVIIDNYDLDDDDIDYEGIVEDFQDYVADIIKEEGEIGEWYTEFLPPTIDVLALDFSTFGIGEVITLNIPEEVDVYYNLTGDKVTVEDEKYEDSITIEEVGEYTLMVASINEIGMKGEESSAFITISDEPVVMLTANYTDGTYDGPITIYFEGFDSSVGEVFYVLDGTVPDHGFAYDPSTGLVLYAGDYEINAAFYNLESDETSEPISLNITVTGETGGANFDGDVVIEMAILDVSEDVTYEIKWAIDEFLLTYPDIAINVTEYLDYADIINAYDSGYGPDVIYTWSSYAIELYNYIGDVTSIVDIKNNDDFYPGVVESTFFWDGYYSLPVTTRPMALLYYNYTELSGIYNEGIGYDMMVSEIEDDLATLGLVFPSSTEIMTFLSYYYGLGGEVSNTLGYVTLDYQPLVDALSLYKQMSEDNIVDYTTTVEMWDDHLYNGTADFIVADPIETQTDYMAYDYEPTGLIPLPSGGKAAYPSRVDGLFVEYYLSLEPTSDKAQVIKLLYEHLAFDTFYNGYIAGVTGAMPAVSGIVNDYDYTTALPIDYYETLLMETPPFSNDLYDLTYYYIDLESIIYDAMTDAITPEQGATLIMDAVEGAYAE